MVNYCLVFKVLFFTALLSRSKILSHWLLFVKCFLQLFKLPAERMGFEPMCPWRQTVFKTASLWPLRYLSVSCLTILQHLICFVKYFFILFSSRARLISGQESFYHLLYNMSTSFFIFFSYFFFFSKKRDFTPFSRI